MSSVIKVEHIKGNTRNKVEQEKGKRTGIKEKMKFSN